MTEKQTEDIASKVVDKLKAGNAFRGCPLSRDEQVAVKDLAGISEEVQELATGVKKGKKYFGILFIAFLMLAAKGIYEYFTAFWHTVTR